MQEKNKQIELQHRKLLQEYNAILIALITVPVGMMGLSFTITNSVATTIFIGVMIFIAINSFKEDKSTELDKKSQEIE